MEWLELQYTKQLVIEEVIGRRCDRPRARAKEVHIEAKTASTSSPAFGYRKSSGARSARIDDHRRLASAADFEEAPFDNRIGYQDGAD